MNKAEAFVKQYLEEKGWDDEIIEYVMILDIVEQYAQQEYERGWEDARKIYRPEI